MKKLMICVVAALMVACASVHRGSVVKKGAKAPSPTSVPAQDPTEGPRPEDPKSYLVRLNLVVFPDEVQAYPVITHALEEALSEWMHEVPIEIAPMIDDHDPSMPQGMPTIADEPGVVRVHIASVNGPPYFMPPGVLGFWDAATNLLVLDTSYLEADPDMAYSVCLHELGHVLGLPHIENRNSPYAISGEIIVPDDCDAARMVMYPMYDPDKNRRAHLTQLEIDIVRENILDLRKLIYSGCTGFTLN